MRIRAVIIDSDKQRIHGIYTTYADIRGIFGSELSFCYDGHTVFYHGEQEAMHGFTLVSDDVPGRSFAGLVIAVGPNLRLDELRRRVHWRKTAAAAPPQTGSFTERSNYDGEE